MQVRRLEVVFLKDTDDDLVNDAREHDHQYGGENVRQTRKPPQGGANEAMRGAGHETGGLMMECNKKQALVNCFHFLLLQKDPFARTALGGETIVQITRGYRTELNLNNKQITTCKKHAGAARYAHNWGLKRKQEVYQTTGRSNSAMELHRELNQRKLRELPWMYEVSRHRCTIRQVEEMLTNLGEPLDGLEAED